MSNQENELPELPEAVHRSIEGKDSGTVTTLLAVHRNRLAMRQSGLAELRANLSNESTHLAYLRMAISLVVFGISLNQFSQFLQDQNRVDIGGLLRNTEFAGAGMVILGVVVALWSLFRYWVVRQAIRRGHSRPFDVAVVILTLLLVVPAIATVAWILNR